MAAAFLPQSPTAAYGITVLHQYHSNTTWQHAVQQHQLQQHILLLSSRQGKMMLVCCTEAVLAAIAGAAA
jgi:hypothetical protein